MLFYLVLFCCVIVYTEEKAHFLRPLEDVTLNEVGLTAAFECEVSREGLKAEWQKANKPVKVGGRISIVAGRKIHLYFYVIACTSMSLLVDELNK